MSVIKVVKVFLASPSGLDEERMASRDIVEEVNRSNSEHWGCQIQLVGWEWTLPGRGRAQGRINQDLDKCQYFIGLMFNRWGSMPDDGPSGYTSGFEEEYCRAKDHLVTDRMNDLTLLFKDIPREEFDDIGPQLQKVIEFKREITEQKQFMYQSFTDLDQFKAVFRESIVSIGWRETERKFLHDSIESDIDQSAQGSGDIKGEDTSGAGLLGDQASEFLVELTQRPSDPHATSAVDIARLRLISCMLTRTNNDESALGNHDANLLFFHRNRLDLSPQEIKQLVWFGMVGFSNQNVPLWHWLADTTEAGDYLRMVRIASLFGRDVQKVNAIKLLQCSGESVPEIPNALDAETNVNSWFNEHTGEKVFEAAIQFLSTNASESQVSFIDELVIKAPEKRQPRIKACIISILSRENVCAAVVRLRSTDADPLNDDTVERIFNQRAKLATDDLKGCLSLKSDKIRKMAMLALREREVLTSDELLSAINDTDIEIRLEALDILADRDLLPDDQVVISALRVRSQSRKPTFGLFTFGHNDSKYLTEFRRRQLEKLDYKELAAKALSSDLHALTVQYQKFTRKSIDEIRENLGDQFKSLLSNNGRDKSENDGIAGILTLDRSVSEQKRLVKTSLNILCDHSDREDLTLVRKYIDQDVIEDCSKSVVSYISKFGDWNDVDRLVKIFNKRESGAGLLSSFQDARDVDVGAALYSLGKKRIIDLLTFELPEKPRVEVARSLTQSEVASLSDELILKLLTDDNDDLRKTLALKCVQALTKTRLRQLLDQYMYQQNRYFYNSAHWLDLGQSIPRDLARQIANFELSHSG